MITYLQPPFYIAQVELSEYQSMVELLGFPLRS